MAWAYVETPCTNCTTGKCTGCPSSRCVSNQPGWSDNFTVRNLNDNKPICPFGGVGNAVVPVATWIPSAASVAAMVSYHLNVTTVGYDGIYIDDYMSSYYSAWQTYIQVSLEAYCTTWHGRVWHPRAVALRALCVARQVWCGVLVCVCPLGCCSQAHACGVLVCADLLVCASLA